MVKADDYQPEPGPLTAGEQAVLARDAVWQQYQHQGSMDPSDCFDAGWDAALAWVEEQRGQSGAS